MMLFALLLAMIKAIPDTIKDYTGTQHDIIDNICGLYDDPDNEYQNDDTYAIYDKIEMLESVLSRQEEEIKIKQIVYNNEKELYDRIPYWEQENKQDKHTWMQQKKMLNAQIAYNKAIDRRDRTKVRIIELKEKAGLMDDFN